MKKCISTWVAMLVLLMTMQPISAMTVFDVTLPPSDDMAAVTYSIQMMKLAPQLAASDVTYESDEQVLVATLRQAMKERRGTVVLYCAVPGNMNLRSYSASLMEQAMQETGDGSEGDYLRWQTGNWSWGGGAMSDGDTLKLMITYRLSYYTTATQEQEVTQRVNRIIESFDFDTNTTDYQKVCTVYEYIAEHMTYDYDHLSNTNYYLQYTAYAALVNGTSVCQGYANLLYRMLNDCGVPCRIITGIAGGGNHAWNLVKVGDKWYNVDLTWDDAYEDEDREMRPYFLRGSETFANNHNRNSEYVGTFDSVYPTSVDDYVPTPCDLVGHNFKGEIKDNDNDTHSYKCTRCDVYGNPVNHTYSTCTDCKDGVNHQKTCACSHTLMEVHNWNAGTVIKAATCTETGIKNYSCTECDATKTETIKTAAHTLVKTEAKAATCTEVGNNAYYTCKCCGKFFSDAEGTNVIANNSWVKNALGHDFKGKMGVCAICGYIDPQVYDLNGDSEVTAADLTKLLRHVAKIAPIEDKMLLNRLDYSDNGEIDAADVTILAQYLASLTA